MRPPMEPGYTCGGIDDAIRAMEDVRKENEKLREWGSYWKDRADEAEQRVAELEDELDAALKSAEA